MAFQPQSKPRKYLSRKYPKQPPEKNKKRKPISKRVSKPPNEQKRITTAKEVTEITLQRLHTLGNQRFEPFPFSEHFNRWLTNVKEVLSEFESNPNTSSDNQYILERTQILTTIEQQLAMKRQKETALNEEEKSLNQCKNLLTQIKTEYVAKLKEVNKQKNREIKQLYRTINRLRKDQDETTRMKTGFFRGISKKSREQKEFEIEQKLAQQERTLELSTLNYKDTREKLRDEYETKTAPVVDRMKNSRNKLKDAETDASLEDRWFACDALVDAVNTYLQRKNTAIKS